MMDSSVRRHATANGLETREFAEESGCAAPSKGYLPGRLPGLRGPPRKLQDPLLNS